MGKSLVEDLIVIDKNGEESNFNSSRLLEAVNKAAFRTGSLMNDKDSKALLDYVMSELASKETVHTYKIHNLVVKGLKDIRPDVSKLYKKFRDYRRQQGKRWNDLYETTDSIKTSGMTENANKDSSIISTQRSLLAETTMKELVKDYMLTEEWKEAHEAGNIYIHDLGDMYSGSYNCCMADMGTLVHKKANSDYSFQISGSDYTQPKHVLSLFNLLGDLTLAMSSNQFGGFTLPEIDTIAAPYAESSYKIKLAYYLRMFILNGGRDEDIEEKISRIKYYYTFEQARDIIPGLLRNDFNMAHNLAEKDVKYEIKQGIQGYNLKINTTSNALGQTPFVTLTFGLDTNHWARMISSEFIRQRTEPKNKLIFPKLVFLYKKEINGDEFTPNRDIYELAMKCSSTKLYPDYLSMDSGFMEETYLRTGGTKGDINEKPKGFGAGEDNAFGTFGDRTITNVWSDEENRYIQSAGLTINPMGCRAYLNRFDSNEFNNEEDYREIYTGRGNLGVVTLNPVKYAIDSEGDWDKFYELVSKYMHMSLDFQQWRYDIVGNLTGSSNPLMWTQGGAWDYVEPHEKVRRLVDAFSASVGYVGLNEAFNYMFMMNGTTGSYDPSEDRESVNTKYSKEYSTYANKTLPDYSVEGERLKRYQEFFNFILDIKDERIKTDTTTHIDEKGNSYLFVPRYTVYGTPAESLVFRFMNQLRETYGVIPNVTDRMYLTNSFHVPVWVNVNALEKVKFEESFHQLSPGGHITYTEFSYGVSPSAMKPVIDFAMRKGTYFGTNVISGTCESCGYQGDFVEECPECKSDDVISINRVCGYLSLSSRKGKAVVNEGKSREILDRVDHSGSGMFKSLRDTESNHGEKFLNSAKGTII